MSTRQDNYEKIHDRAKCICEICQQMQWRKCENGPIDRHCEQLISKFGDHDHGYMLKSERVNGTLFHIVKIAGVKVDYSVLDKYVSHIIERMRNSKIPSRKCLSEMQVGQLEEERAALHGAVLMSIGFGFQDMSTEARIFCGVLEKYVEMKAGKQLSNDVDLDDWIRRNYEERMRASEIEDLAGKCLENPDSCGYVGKTASCICWKPWKRKVPGQVMHHPRCQKRVELFLKNQWQPEYPEESSSDEYDEDD